MIEEALKYLVGLGNARVITVNERPYHASNGKGIKEPEIQPLDINTLTGLVDYANNYPKDGMFLHIMGPTKVELTGEEFLPWKQRDCLVTSRFQGGDKYPFGTFLPVEEFIVELQANFVQDETTATILQRVGNITDEAVKNVSDDGQTQTVQVRAGITRMSEANIPNPVTLRPFRTFTEIDQPASNYVLRLKSGAGELPRCALFKVDSGLWALKAIAGVKAWLRGQLPDINIIA